MKTAHAILVVALALCAAGAHPAAAREARTAPPLSFRDDLGAPVPGLEVCFQVHGARRCPEVDPAAGVRWPADATALWAAGPGHGPVWIERDAPGRGTAGPEVVVPRKAELTVEGIPAGASLAFYRAGDRAFTVPLDRFRVLDPARRILAPPGATVLAIRHRSRDRDGAPDLHRLDAPPGGAVRVRYTPRTGWSAVLRTTAWIDRSPLPGTTVRWIESSPTAPRAKRSELAALETGGDGLVLLSGIEAAMTSAEVTREDHAPQTIHGLVAPLGGLLYREVALRPGGTVAAHVLWRGEPAAGLRIALFAQPTDPDRRVEPSEVAFRGRLDDDGRLRIEHLPEGRYLLRVSPPAGSGLSSHADLVLRVEDRRVTEVTADLRPRTVRGRVTRGGAGAGGHRLHARVVRAVTEPDEEGRRRPVLARTAQDTVVTGEDGGYELTLLADGVYLVALHAADGTPIASRYVRLNGGDAEVSFRLASETLSGRVVSSRGGVVGGAEVWVRWGGDRYVQRASTRADGRFDFPFEADRVSSSPVVVGAIEDGWLGDEREVAIGEVGASRFEPIEGDRREGDRTVRIPGPEDDAPAPPDRIDLVLEPLGRVRGRVVDGDGRPVVGAWVASCLDRPGSLHFVGTDRTADDGSFTVPSGVADGAPPPRREPVRLYVSAPGCPLTETLVEPSDWPRDDDPPGEREEPPPVIITCDTPPAVLRVHVAFSRSHPLPGERITLRRNGRVLPPQVLEGHLDELGLPRTTGHDGSILLVLEPGRWQLYRAKGTSATKIRSGDESGLLGKVALDPWTVTDLDTGTDDRR